MAGYAPPAATLPGLASDRVCELDINDYSRNMYGTAFSELTAVQREHVAAVMSSDQCASTGTIPADSEAATATRLANRAARASDREAVRNADDYAMATYGVNFSALTPAQMEDVSNYMRDDEKRTFGTVIAGGQASQAKRQADIAYAATPEAAAAGATVMPSDPRFTAAATTPAAPTSAPNPGDMYTRPL